MILCWSHGNIEKITNKKCFRRFVRPDVEKKRGNPSKNYSPPIPPTRIPFLLNPDLFYVRFFDLFGSSLVAQFFQFFGPHWTPWAKGRQPIMEGLFSSS